MEKQDYIDYWKKISENDLSSMESNFNNGKFDWSLFIGHLALEKVLKALWIKNNSNITPPRTHNLNKIANEAGFILSDSDSETLLEITGFNLEARYPDYKMEFLKKCNKDFTEKYIIKIREFYQCIANQI